MRITAYPHLDVEFQTRGTRVSFLDSGHIFRIIDVHPISPKHLKVVCEKMSAISDPPKHRALQKYIIKFSQPDNRRSDAVIWAKNETVAKREFYANYDGQITKIWRKDRGEK